MDQDSNPGIDRELFEKYSQMKRNTEMDEFHRKLPSYALKDKLLDTIDKNQVTIVTGQTGCGKSTQVPRYVLHDWLVTRKRGSECRILCTQPRRICATSLASRVSDEWGDSDAVGYHIRFEPSLPRSQGSITFCTTGIALKYIESDLILSRYSHIFVDEVHERALETELLLIHLKELMETRKDLKIVLMSASVQAEKFSEWLGNCPIVDIPARRFDVRSFFLEDIVDQLNPQALLQTMPASGSRNRTKNGETVVGNAQLSHLPISKNGKLFIQAMEKTDKICVDLISAAYGWLIKKHPATKSVLVFLPGMGDIGKCSKLMRQNYSNIHIVPLHSMLPKNIQMDAFRRAPANKIKVILSTNIAESSITIDDIDAVIDFGYSKQEGYDVGLGTKLLNQALITKANVCQRKGRAGRVRDGTCIHLYTRNTHDHKMADFPTSGLLNTLLDQVVLQIKASGYHGDIRTFLAKAIDRPSEELVNSSVEFLHKIAAIDKVDNERLTACGYLLSQLPCDAQIAKMVLLGTLFHCINPIVTIASFLSSPDPFYVIPGEEAKMDKIRKTFRFADSGPASFSDHLLFLNVFEKWSLHRNRGTHLQFCDQHFLSDSKMCNIRRTRHQLWDLLKSLRFFDFKTHNYDQFSDQLDLISFILSISLCCRDCVSPQLSQPLRYPNIAIPKTLTSTKRPISLKTETNKSLTVSQRSLCSNMKVTELPSLYYCYYDKVKSTGGTFVYDLSPINPLALLFCAQTFEPSTKHSKQVRDFNNDRKVFVLDDWIEIKVSMNDLLKAVQLRRTFDSVVEDMINKPQCVNIDSDTKIVRSIRTIVSAICHQTRLQ